MSDKQPVVEARAATIADAAEIARIYNHYIRQGGVTFDFVEYPEERIVKLLHHGEPGAWFVATSGNLTLGWASARPFSDRPGYRKSCETAIYMDPSAIGTGAAKVLHQRVEQHCLDAGIHHAVAKIVGGNDRSLAFHYRYGYELVGTQKEIGCVNDQWLDVVILQRIFRAADFVGRSFTSTKRKRVKN